MTDNKLSPWNRFLGLLELDRKDIFQILDQIVTDFSSL